MGLLKRRAEEHLDASARGQRGAWAVRVRGGLKASAQACTRDVRSSVMGGEIVGIHVGMHDTEEPMAETSEIDDQET